MTVGRHRQFLLEVMDAFEGRGYRVRRDYKVLQAAEYGVPQSRKRLFLFGARNGIAIPDYPSPITTRRTTTGELADGELPPVPSVWDAIGDLPEIEQYPELLTSDCVEAKFGEPSEYARNLRDPAMDVSNFARARPLSLGFLTSSLRTSHTNLSIQRFDDTDPGATEPVSRFLRLHPEGISNTLRAGTARDRGAFTLPRPIHPVQPRCITVREAARLHGYPDWFRLHSTKWHGFRQIGNSVPPPLGQSVATALLKAANIEPQHGEPTDLGSENLLYIAQGSAADRFGLIDTSFRPGEDSTSKYPGSKMN